MKYKVLFLCTRNSARSQMAETILDFRGNNSFDAYSAGSMPAEEIHPIARDVLTNSGFDMIGKRPKNMSEYSDMDFDFIITLCDSMKETCPVFPGQPIYAHWGMTDPADVQGMDDEILKFFKKTMLEINHRITLFLNLPMDKLDRLALEQKVRQIGQVSA